MIISDIIKKSNLRGIKMRAFIIFCILIIISTAFAQIHYPFDEDQEKSAILAYWYNIPEDSVSLRMMGTTFKFHSSLQIYGVRPSNDFIVKVKVYLKNGEIAFNRKCKISENNQDKPYTINFNTNFFKMEIPVKKLKQNPEKIVVTVSSLEKEISKEIKCKYHRLFGKITNFSGQPFRAFVAIRPDAFSFTTAVWSDSLGNYEIYLPERTYNNIAVDDESYGIKTAEAWAWHIILDNDQRLDFKVGTGEVYNLNVWPNNGGGNTFFISFRPMSLHLFKNMGKKIPVTIGDSTYSLIDVGPDLTINDISVNVNDQQVKVISLQKYYETAGGYAMLAYLLQVNRDNLSKIGKQTIHVIYENGLEIEGKKLTNNSMGYYQIYLNYFGLTTYF
jgi:hypothetical protein